MTLREITNNSLEAGANTPFIISRKASEKGPGETYQVKRFSHSNLKLQSARRSV